MKPRYVFILALLLALISLTPARPVVSQVGKLDIVVPTTLPALNLALAGDPATLDPALAADTTSIEIIEQLFTPLMDYDDRTGNLVPALATGWEVSADAQVFTFTLRSDALWSDGKPVTAADIRYGVLRTLDPQLGSGYAYPLYVILNAQAYYEGTVVDPNQVGVQALDATHLRVEFEQPTVFAPAIFSLWVTAPMPAWAISSHGAAWTDPGNIVTNGAYRLVENVPSDHLRLQKNPTYFAAGTVQIDDVWYWIEPDGLTAWQMYLDGDLDSVNVPLGAAVDPLVWQQEVRSSPDDCTYYYGFVHTKPPMDDERVRKAFAMATRKWQVVDYLGGGQQPASHFAPPMIFGSPAPESIGLDYNPTAARAYLQDYLNEKGMTLADFNALGIELRYNTSDTHAAIAQEIAEDWVDNLGVSVLRTDIEWQDYLGTIVPTAPVEGAPHIYRLGWCSDYPDENNWIHQVFNNQAGINRLRRGCLDPNCDTVIQETFDQLTFQAAAEQDLAARAALYLEAERILVEEAHYIPIYWYASVIAAKPYLDRTYPVFGTYDLADWQLNITSAEVPPDGGEVISPDGDTVLDFPAGAFDEAMTVTYSEATAPPPAEDLVAVQPAFDVSASTVAGGLPGDLAPGEVFSMTVTYDPAALGPTDEATLALFAWDGSAWVQEPTSTLDTINHTVTATPDHLSVWILAGSTERVYLPVTLKFAE